MARPTRADYAWVGLGIAISLVSAAVVILIILKLLGVL